MADKKRRQKMFISVLPGEQVEVVIAEEGKVNEYYVEMVHQAKTKGNIYKGYIHNIDNGLQAAFINYGAERNGFLQIDEVHPEYYLGSPATRRGQRFPLMQKVLKAGQEVLVQVVKEPTGKKGAFLTSYLSLPGRSFVYTVGRSQMGVSRKIENEKERVRLKKALESFETTEGVGLIARTAAVGQSKAALERDFKYLNRLWSDIRANAQKEKAPSIVYHELGLAARAVRDYLTSDITEIWVDDKDTFKQIQQFVKLAFPRKNTLAKLHEDHDLTLLERFNLTKQVQEIYSREASMPSGGRLVFDATEALTAVDINSGKIGGERNFQKMALKTNVEAAREIARQLRLRDIGGQVVIDFIEMKNPKDCREVEKAMKAEMKHDRARTDVSRISPFGLMELVRQRLGSSAIAISTEPCPCCNGTGIRRNMEWQALQALKDIHREIRKPSVETVEHTCEEELAIYLLNNKRKILAEMEDQYGKEIHVDIEYEYDE
ncbi:Rne/Rng family ribonuclease [Pseudodesulfovibrio sp.]|nr:Rne/Rng family ribonuclease [Pseudodesulfovibrio sp.]